MSSSTVDAYEFGPYRLDVQRRALLRDDHLVPLRPKTFELLLLLVQSQGRAVSKQHMMSALWPDTFVEEGNLSFQISALRRALGAEGARWIETVPKHGYRFAADVKAISCRSQTLPVAATQVEAAPSAPLSGGRPSRRRWLAALVAAPVLGTALYIAFQREPPSEPNYAPRDAVPLTTYPGYEIAPSLSPDGTRVAFSWEGWARDNRDIYVKLIGPGEPVRLTTDPAREFNPAWSPDGRWIAFERHTVLAWSARTDLYVVPALGGAAEKRVAANLRANVLFGVGPNGSVTWTPDGQWLAHWAEPEQPGIWLFSVDGSQRRRLTEDGAGRRSPAMDVTWPSSLPERAAYPSTCFP